LIVKVVQAYLVAVRHAGIRAVKAVVFGSHARGQAGPDSDIDLVVIAPEFDDTHDRRLGGILWRLRARTDSRIEPVGVGVRQWEEDQGNPLLAVVRAEGEEIVAPA